VADRLLALSNASDNCIYRFCPHPEVILQVARLMAEAGARGAGHVGQQPRSVRTRRILRQRVMKRSPGSAGRCTRATRA